MDKKYLNEIKEDADRLIELANNPYCQGPVSLLSGVKHVIPILLEKVDELQLDYNKIATENVTLKAEVERLRDCKCVDKCKLVCMLDEYDKIVEERNTLKRALELACAVLNLSDVEKVFASDYFIQQAQEQEADHDAKN